MKRNIRTISSFAVIALALLVVSCYEKETLDVPVTEVEEPQTELDLYIQENFVEEYDMAVRYKYNDIYVPIGRKVTPPRIEVVSPMLDFIENFWIDPYKEIDNGLPFFKEHVPPEIVLLGGIIYNPDGTILLGVADAGARITFVAVNDLDLEDSVWRDRQLNVVYHEFAHIVHQRYKLPAAFETIAAGGYTSPGSWFTLSDEEALFRGFVSPYATSSPNEDFAETVSFFLFHQEFYEIFINDETNCATAECLARNAGRVRIRLKLAAISDHYKKQVGIDLLALRNAIQSRL